jgi:hypothetical protein
MQPTAPPRFPRLAVALLAGLIAGLVAGVYHRAFNRGAGDLTWALCYVRALAAGLPPYATCPALSSAGAPMPSNPLTTGLLVAPLALLPGPAAAGAFVGLSTTALVWGVLRTGEPWRLLILAAWPFWACVQVANWSILLTAAVYLPALAIVAAAKPHVGVPMLATHALRRPWATLLPVAALGVASLALRPTWPREWLASIHGYSGASALLMLPLGPLLLLAVLRGRAWQGRYLLLCALLPTRLWYDPLILAPVFRSWRGLAAWVVCGWVAALVSLHGLAPAPALAVPLLWGPALVAVLGADQLWIGSRNQRAAERTTSTSRTT